MYRAVNPWPLLCLPLALACTTPEAVEPDTGPSPLPALRWDATADHILLDAEVMDINATTATAWEQHLTDADLPVGLPLLVEVDDFEILDGASLDLPRSVEIRADRVYMEPGSVLRVRGDLVILARELDTGGSVAEALPPWGERALELSQGTVSLAAMSCGANGVDGADAVCGGLGCDSHAEDGRDGDSGCAGDDGANGSDIFVEAWIITSSGDYNAPGGDGGDGGAGGDGGDGGDGDRALLASTSYHTPGAGGDGGAGGAGGRGGDGGVVEIHYCLDLTSGDLSTDVSGGAGGEGGIGGRGGKGGEDGKDGADGADGTDGASGTTGASGAGGSVHVEHHGDLCLTAAPDDRYSLAREIEAP